MIILEIEEIFDEINNCHLAVGHVGIDKTLKEVKKNLPIFKKST